MAWSKISDDFYDHPKTICCSLAAVGLWTCCLSYAARHSTGGKVLPTYALSRGTQSEIDELVAAGLWDVDGDGWRFHDYSDYIPTTYEQRKYKTSKNPDKMRAGAAGGQRTSSRRAAARQQMSSPVPVPNTSSNEEVVRDDVAAIIAAFNQSLTDRGVAAKKPTKAWTDAARLMLDRDGRTVDQVTRCIQWVTENEFWRGNILSLPTLREKYDQLRLQAQRDQANTRPAHGPVSVSEAMLRHPDVGSPEWWEEEHARRSAAGE